MTTVSNERNKIMNLGKDMLSLWNDLNMSLVFTSTHRNDVKHYKKQLWNLGTDLRNIVDLDSDTKTALIKNVYNSWKHLDDIDSLNYTYWKLHMFEVEDPMITEAQRQSIFYCFECLYKLVWELDDVNNMHKTDWDEFMQIHINDRMQIVKKFFSSD